MMKRLSLWLGMLALLAAWSPARACEGAGCANGLVYEAFGPAPGAGRR